MQFSIFVSIKLKVRSHCPVNYALEHFGNKWYLLIIRDLIFKGKRHYNEFFESKEKVSTSVLGARLKRLEELGIIYKKDDHVKKSRIRYNLTQKGIDMLPIVVEIVVWSGGYDKESVIDKEFLFQARHNKAELLRTTRKRLEQQHLDD